MSDVQAKLEERKATLQKEFDAVSAELKDLTEQGKVLNKKASELRVKQVQISGAYQEVKALLEEPKEEPKKVPAKK